ncbi:MAG: thiol reductant ABC exporter subunit CydC [Terracoccus sp.]
MSTRSASAAIPARPAAAPRPVWRPTAGTVRGGLLGGLATASGMALTATSGWLIVSAAQMPPILTLLTAIVAVRAFGMARPTFRYAERLASHDAALGTLADRRTEAYAALIPLTPARLGRRRRSDVLTGVVEDLTDEVDAQVRVTVPVISTVLAGGIVIAVTAALAPVAAAVLLVLALVVATLCRVALSLESRWLGELLVARAEVARVSELTTGQAQQLRAVGGWGTALGWLDDAHAGLDRATRRLSTGRALASGGFLLAVGAAVVAVALVARDLDVSTPVKALLVLTPVAVTEAITPLVDAMRALARATGSAERVRGLLTLDPAVTEPGDHPGIHPDDDTHHHTGDRTTRPTGPRPPRIECVGLTASWTGERTDLGPLDLTIAPGARLAVTGPNGSGKSTLLAILARHLDPSSGTVRIDGADVTTLPLEQVRALVAVVDDEPHVFATSVRHNLLLAAPEADDEAVAGALERAGLGALLADLTEGLDTVLGEGGRGLSGGERARLGIARALLSGRPVILLDEPVAHLDPPTATAVVDDLMAAERDDPTRTIIMVTHRPEGLDRFDSVVHLTPPRP